MTRFPEIKQRIDARLPEIKTATGASTDWSQAYQLASWDRRRLVAELDAADREIGGLKAENKTLREIIESLST